MNRTKWGEAESRREIGARTGKLISVKITIDRKNRACYKKCVCRHMEVKGNPHRPQISSYPLVKEVPENGAKQNNGIKAYNSRLSKEETIMASDRIQLNEENLDEVVGGKFVFYTDQNGNPRCKVTDIGRFYTTSDGFFKYITMKNEQPGLSDAEYVQIALSKGIIWNNP